jgi:hypothetical protein
MQRYVSLCGTVLIAALAGCKTAEVAMTHPATGVQIVARFESFEPSAYQMQPVAAREELAAIRLPATEPIVVR